MAKVSLKAIEPLVMEFADGTSKKALFNNEALRIFNKEFDSLDNLMKTELPVKPYDFAAKVLYSGMKVLDKSVTLEEAMYILMCGGEPLLHEVATLLIDNFMATATESQKKAFIKEIEAFNSHLEETFTEKN